MTFQFTRRPQNTLSWLTQKICILIFSIFLLYFIFQSFIFLLFIFQKNIIVPVVPTKLNPSTVVQTLEMDSCEFGNLTNENVFSGNLRLAQDDETLLGFVKKCHMIPPSILPYNLTDPTGDPSAEQGVRKYVSRLLGNKKNGVYIDCGANDGEDISNTLVLERDYGWTGLLIEADPNNIKNLLTKNRKSWIANVCIGIHKYPYQVEMFRHKDWPLTSRLAAGGYWTDGSAWSKFNVKCLPLYTMMRALNLIDLDYISMDIEGVELKVLKTLPFDKIKVKVFSIETLPITWDRIRSYMKSKDYAFVSSFHGKLVEDDVFAHKNLFNHSRQIEFKL